MALVAGARRHIAVTSSLIVLASITVLLRFVSRKRARVRLGTDDWTLLISLTLVLAIYIEGLVCKFSHQRLCLDKTLNYLGVLYGGVGKHIDELAPSETTILLKARSLHSRMIPDCSVADLFHSVTSSVGSHLLRHSPSRKYPSSSFISAFSPCTVSGLLVQPLGSSSCQSA